MQGQRTGQYFVSILLNSIPAVLLYLLGIFWSLSLGAEQLPVSGLGQLLDISELTSSPWASLSNLHVQPPGWNALVAVAMNGSLDEGPLFVLNNFIVVVTLLLIVAITLTLSKSQLAAVLASCLFALLPSTILYAFWPYNTALVGMLVLLVLFGTTQLKRHLKFGLTVSSFALLGLFLVRPTYHWVPITVGLAALLFLTIRRYPGQIKASLLIVGCVTATVLAIQVHYVVQFGQFSTSSWSGANVVKALSNSGYFERNIPFPVGWLTEECVKEIVANSAFLGSPSRYVSCLQVDAAPTGYPVLDFADKANGAGNNYNSADYLLFYKAIDQLGIEMIKRDPGSLLMIPAVSLKIFFSDPNTYAYVDANAAVLPPPWRLTTGLGSIFPPFMWGILFACAPIILRIWARKGTRHDAFCVGLALLFFHSAVSIIAEVGENFRFHVEVYGLLVTMVVISVSAIWKHPGLNEKYPQVIALKP